ncbi:MAG: NTP transferase domain-containing protein [Planctomycetota bacterium]
MLRQNKLILWVGEKHSGKTTSAAELAQAARAKGITIAGLLAPSIYNKGELTGFDVLDLRTEALAALAIRRSGEGRGEPYTFTAEGLKVGRSALSADATKSAELIIVDEFGPLELSGGGWRKDVDSLLTSSDAVILLVVRRELAEEVRRLYAEIPSHNISACEKESVDKVITVLEKRSRNKTGNEIQLDGMLMIGSAGSNVGKTELACALIRKFGKSIPITGIKVTTIEAKDGQCPRGGEGCGVCSSLDGDFYITEETSKSSGKDTARLLAAGARRVFWLRVMKTHLKEGIKSLLDVAGQAEVLVCESNSLREVVEPGLFFILRGRDSKAWKSSARDVKRYADRIVVGDGRGFDFDIDRVKLADGKWTMPERATAIIMAGGGSQRMGTDKSMLPIKDKSMIETICEQLRGTFGQILISANNVEKYAFLVLPVIKDKIRGQGPLMGIASAVAASENEVNFVTACDIPHIEMSFVRRMLVEAEGYDIVIPADKDGRNEPLFAVYNKSSLKAINEVLKEGGRKISDVFARCRVKYIELERDIANLNTRAEYEEFLEKYGA